jgi:hypothetical protein
METQTSQQKRRSWFKKILIYGIPGGVILLVAALFAVMWMISGDVEERCVLAQKEFGGDCVEALIAVFESDQQPFYQKNEAIWALGQIGDRRALPALEKMYTGEPCEKPCNSRMTICQYGLEKAIKNCKGFNLGRVVWKVRQRVRPLPSST